MASYGDQSPSLECRKRSKSKKKGLPSIHVLLLRPTQFNVGYSQIEKVVASTNAQLAEATTKKEAKKILRNMNRRKKVPVVYGPGGEFFMLDHHHWARALWESDVKFARKQVNYYVIADLSFLEPADFWEEMKRNKWVYLNSCGEPQRPECLPTDVTTLQDDPYRSLARSVRGRRKGWKKTKLPFTEFIWADYLRTFASTFAPLVLEGQRLESKENHDLYDLAINLCRAESASALPGYLGPIVPQEEEEESEEQQQLQEEECQSVPDIEMSVAVGCGIISVL